MERIVFSDMDGTLLDPAHKITPLTQTAIRRLKERGIPFVIVSARSPSGIYPILEEYGFRCPVIAYSGALILDEYGQVLFHKGMEKKQVKRILDFAKEHSLDMSWCIYSLDQWIVQDKQDPRIIREETIVRAKATEGTVENVTDDQVNKILCICGPGKLCQIDAQLREAFPEFSIAPDELKKRIHRQTRGNDQDGIYYGLVEAGVLR